MGAGIAHAVLVNGADVLVVERDDVSAEAARERVEAAVLKSIELDVIDGSFEELITRLVCAPTTIPSRTGSWWWKPGRRTGT